MPAAAAVGLVRAAIDPTVAAGWLDAIDAHPAWRRRGAVAAEVRRGVPGADAAVIGDRDFNPYSSSLRLGAVAGIDARSLAHLIAAGESGRFCRGHLGAVLRCNLDQCWVRRQYAPARYPPLHAPHAWHQDGALGFDFLGTCEQAKAQALIEMVTCWVALTPCGAHAPGLELVTCATALRPIGALSDGAVRHDHDPSHFWRPVLEAGDVLVFTGGVLHHTHVDAPMQQDRTSLELRFFGADSVPERLRDDTFFTLDPT